MTETPAQHPWAKYYSERGLARPVVATLVNPTPTRRASRDTTANPASKPLEMSTELAAAVAAIATHEVASGTTAAPFVTTAQRAAVVRQGRRQARIRAAKMVVSVVGAFVALHLVITQIVYHAPSPEALQAHIQALPETLIPLFSSVRQPLQADGVVLVQEDKIGLNQVRYVAAVTLRLRQPLYVAAVTNGTAQYRRVQESLQNARDQELRYNLFSVAAAPEVPALPILLQRSHKAGETIVVRVPFIARRFGWQWRLGAPQAALRLADRALQGDSLAHYSDTPHLLFGEPRTLAEVRRRIRQATDYVTFVAREVQKRSQVVAVVDAPAGLADQPAQDFDAALADQPAVADEGDLANAAAVEDTAVLETLPAIDPNAPAVFLPMPSRLAVRSAPKASR